jgi:hypothetical protein
MPTAFAIQFDPGHENGYLPGSWISGRVFLILSKPLRTRGLRLKFKGYEYTHWTTGSSKHRRTHTETSIIFDQNITLVGFQQGESVSNALLAELPAGNSVYPFRIQVPNIHLPASIQLNTGYIRYELSAYIDIVGWFDKYSPTYLIRINQILLVNSSELLKPIAVHQDQVMGCFSNQGVISMICSIAKQGYLPGETIIIDSQITNNSKRTKILSVNAILRQKVVFKAHSSTRKTELAICNMDIETMLPAGSPAAGFQNRITIPSNVVFSSCNARLVNVSYVVSVILNRDGCGFAIEGDLPIFIGNSTLDNQQPVPMPSTGISALQYTIDQPQYPQQLDSELPPYQEILGDVSY